MRSTLRYRQVHLDFHTSEHIPGIGADFDADQFAATLKRGNVNSVTVFARGHHGWSYYPTRVGTPHPNLARPDLLGEMVEACRANDINVPIYITVQWDELTARQRPDWRVMSATNSAVSPDPNDPSAMNQLTATWHTLCLNNPEYVDFLIRQAHEVMERYQPDGLFMDIVGKGDCVCPRCLASMQEKGLDPTRPEDRAAHDHDVVMWYYRTFTEAIWARDPEMRVFHNSGHIYRGERQRYKYFSHLELESLPTGGWGYDHFPVSARYVHTLGMEYLGMTGKFHTMWGEFGGYKRPEALEYECALMSAFGARSSVGDQLPPNGAIDEATYETIRPAYARVAALEPFLEGARSAADIAVLSSDAVNGTEGAATHGSNPSDDGAVRMLLELQLMFDVIDTEADFSAYQLLVLPDDIHLDEALTGKLTRFVDGGGSLILSGSSGMTHDEARFALPLSVQYDGTRRDAWPDYVAPDGGFAADVPRSPVVVYERPYFVKPQGNATVLGRAHDPYFDRSWEHFCSHQHAPPRPEPSDERDAIIRDGRVIYFAHPIFRAYASSGQPLYRDLVGAALRTLVPQPVAKVEMPSAGRISLMKQEEQNRLLLHLLYAQPQLRGRGHRMANGGRIDVEVIEDPVPIHDIPCTVAMAAKPSRVYRHSDGADIDFTYEEGAVRFAVEKVHIHELVVIER